MRKAEYWVFVSAVVMTSITLVSMVSPVVSTYSVVRADMTNDETLSAECVNETSISECANGKLDIGAEQPTDVPPVRFTLSYRPGELIVKFKDAAVSGDRRTNFEGRVALSDKSIDRLNALHDVSSMRPLMRRPSGRLAGLYEREGLDRLYLLATASTTDVLGMAKSYEDNANVEFAQPNYIYNIDTFPNDTAFSELWALHNTGQNIEGQNGRIGADIDAPAAWNITTGSEDVVVAVIDTGVDYTHPDLAANIWTNAGEDANGDGIVNDSDMDGVDNDGNGYVDDLRGWDFGMDDNDPDDVWYHGTHVASTIAAVGDNGYGITGVMWNARIMALQASLQREIHSYFAYAAILYAVDNGADIISASWGGYSYDGLVRHAIEIADDNGVLFIAAAGNDGRDTDMWPHYPSGYDIDNIIAVAATDNTDRLASFSNHGRHSVDIGAPGVDIYGAFPSGYGYRFKHKSGTSMATPHVSGVAGLLRARYPDMSHLDIKQKLLRCIDPVFLVNGEVSSHGRLNAYKALTTPAPVITSPRDGLVTEDQTLTLTGRLIDYENLSSIRVTVASVYQRSTITNGTFRSDITLQREGANKIHVKTTDDAGNLGHHFIDVHWDTTAPRISNVSVLAQTRTVSVGVETNERTTIRVEYGNDTSYGNVTESNGHTTYHYIHIEGLTPNTTGHFRLTASDVVGHQFVSGDFEFRTRSTVNLPPIADAGLDRAVIVDDNVRFDGTASYDPEGFALTFLWEIYFAEIVDMPDEPVDGEPPIDGEPPMDIIDMPVLTVLEGPRPNLTFNETGNYTVVLTVTVQADFDCPELLDWETRNWQATDAMNLTVLNNTSPVALAAGPDGSILTQEVATFNASASHDPDEEYGDTIVRYHWDFGDRTWAEGAVVQHAYRAPRTYRVRLIVWDKHGGSDEATLSVTVRNRAPVANAGEDRVVSVGHQVVFDASASFDMDGEITKYEWHFEADFKGGAEGKGEWMEGMVVSYVFEQIGEYKVILAVTDNHGASDKDIVNVSVVNLKPVARITADKVVPVGQKVAFYGGASYDPDGRIERYIWAVDGVKIGEGEKILHVFNTDGEHEVRLLVIDNYGAKASDIMSIIANSRPVADAGKDQTVHVKEQVTFDGSNSYDPDGRIVRYEWFLNGKRISEDMRFRYTLTTAGTYNVTLLVTDDLGATGIDYVQVTVIDAQWSVTYIE